MTESTLLREVRDRRSLPSPSRRRAIREDAGTSQAAIAAEVRRRTALTCTPEAIGNYEAGRRTPRGALLMAYAEILRELERELQEGPMLPDPRERPLLTVAEVAAFMPAGVGEKAVRAALVDGQLPCQRVGRYVLVPTAALRRLLLVDDNPDMREAGVPTPALALHTPAAAKPLEST